MMWWEQSRGMLLHAAGRIAWPRGQLVTILYHRVLPQPDPLLGDWEIDQAAFEAHMQTLKRYFNVLGLQEAVARLRSGSLPSRAVCVTFDDGYADNEEVALPILQRLQIPATFFIASGFLDGGRMWNDTVIEAVRRTREPVLDLSHLQLGIYSVESLEQRRQAVLGIISRLKYIPLDVRRERAEAIAAHVGEALPDNLMMRDEQVLRLHSEGMEIGGHTVHHPILTAIGAKDAELEMVNGRKQLEDIVGTRISSFAYPNGRPGKDYKRVHVDIAKRAGFDVCVSTAWGAASCNSDLLQLPRISPWDRGEVRFALRVLRAAMGREYDTVD